MTEETSSYSLAAGAPRPPTREDVERALMAIDIEEACEWKWKQGKREHRSSESEGFQGDPLVELHSEGLDALNYLQVLKNAGRYDPGCLEQLRAQALGLVHGARMLAQAEPEG